MSSWLDTGLLLALPSGHLVEQPQACLLVRELGQGLQPTHSILVLVLRKPRSGLCPRVPGRESR